MTGWKKFWTYTPIKQPGEYEGVLLSPKTIFGMLSGVYFDFKEFEVDGDGEHEIKNFMLGAQKERWSARRAAELTKVETLAEIGVQYGDNAFLMYRFFKPKELCLIDPYQETPQPHNGLLTSETSMDIAHEMLGEFPRWFRESSQTAHVHFPDEYFDFIYIDGDHEYEGIKADLDNWYPKVKKGGVLAGDDYAPKYPGVIQAVDEKFPACEKEGREWLWTK